MKKGEVSHSEVKHALKTPKYLKRLICIAGLGGMLLSNACFVGKPTREPTFVPEDNNVRKKHKRRVFVAGHWEKGPRGRRWVRGHWERK